MTLVNLIGISLEKIKPHSDAINWLLHAAERNIGDSKIDLVSAENREFIKKLFEIPGIKKIITNVDPNNLRAINCYKKVDFKFIKELMTPDELAFLMELKVETNI